MAKSKLTVEERFWAKVDKTGACWLWTGCKVRRGYGQFGVSNGLRARAHRFSWELVHGPVPIESYVCHSCDVPACVNPDHLFLGTPKENSQDAVVKGRYTNGHDHYRSKLTEAQVIAIRSDGGNFCSIGRRFGVDRKTVSAIVKRRMWKHLR